MASTPTACGAVAAGLYNLGLPVFPLRDNAMNGGKYAEGYYPIIKYNIMVLSNLKC
jgi:hypothetical protein